MAGRSNRTGNIHDPPRSTRRQLPWWSFAVESLDAVSFARPAAGDASGDRQYEWELFHDGVATKVRTRLGFSTRIRCNVASGTPAALRRGIIVVNTMSTPGPPFVRSYFLFAPPRTAPDKLKSDDRQM